MSFVTFFVCESKLACNSLKSCSNRLSSKQCLSFEEWCCQNSSNVLSVSSSWMRSRSTAKTCTFSMFSTDFSLMEYNSASPCFAADRISSFSSENA